MSEKQIQVKSSIENATLDWKTSGVVIILILISPDPCCLKYFGIYYKFHIIVQFSCFDLLEQLIKAQ